METAIRWSPSSTTSEQCFLIADVNGRTFRHYRIESYDGNRIRYETISTHHTVPAFRAFDWSPNDEAIVAVGQWSGEATVIRLDDQLQSLSLPIKHQRLCNAVTFNRTGLLATGLERVRNDFCLNVWDISQRPLIRPSPGTASGRQSFDPIRKLASSEAITSIKFFPNQPDVLVCGVKGVSIRIYDIRDHTGNPSLQFQTSCVHNIAIDPLDENYFASAGPLKDTTIHIFDRRLSPTSTATNLGSGLVNNTQHGQILEFKKAFENTKSSLQANIWSLRYCKGQSGCLAALASTGDYRIFETKKEHAAEERNAKGPHNLTVNETTQAQKIFVRRIHHVEHSFDDRIHGRPENKRIVSFDFTNLAGFRGRPCAITVRGDQKIEIYEFKERPSALSISPMGSLVIGRADYTSKTKPVADEVPLTAVVNMISASHVGSIASLIKETRNKIKSVSLPKEKRSFKGAKLEPRISESDSAGNVHLSSREAHQALHDFKHPVSRLSVEETLRFSTISRRRCAEGYLFNHNKNIEVVSDDPWLQDFWHWIGCR